MTDIRHVTQVRHDIMRTSVTQVARHIVEIEAELDGLREVCREMDAEITALRELARDMGEFVLSDYPEPIARRFADRMEALGL